MNSTHCGAYHSFLSFLLSNKTGVISIGIDANATAKTQSGLYLFTTMMIIIISGINHRRRTCAQSCPIIDLVSLILFTSSSSFDVSGQKFQSMNTREETAQQYSPCPALAV